MWGDDVVRKISNILPRNSLIAIYKTFVRPHLDYGNVLYDQHFIAEQILLNILIFY